MTYWKNQHFKALQHAWYERLKDIGFVDLEKLVGDEMELIHEAPNLKKRELNKVLNQTQEYYVVIAHKVSEFRFKDVTDELILKRHASGHKIKSICDELRILGMKRCRETIRFTIRKYEMLWGIRKYSQKQMERCAKTA